MERQIVTKVSKTPTLNDSIQRRATGPSSPGHRLTGLQRSIGNQAAQRLINSRYIQAKLQISTPGDPYELEADRVADTIMRMPDPRASSGVNISNRTSISRLNQKCTECEDEEMQRKPSEEEEGEEKEESLQPSATDSSRAEGAPFIVHDVLRSSGQPLDASTRAFMEPRFGRDFSDVRVHADAKAAESAQAVNALAYTVGRDIVFGQGQYRPSLTNGRQLIGHELTHVVQQQAVSRPTKADRLVLDDPHSAHEIEAQRIGANVITGGTASTATSSIKAHTGFSARISRADPAAVAMVMTLGQTPRTGLQFWPTNVTDTRVGPVSVQGGLMSGGASQLNVIIGQNLTLRTLAHQLLPLWTTATPFTPIGAGAPLPLDIITAEELARGLLVYNQTYLPVPAMTNWRAGFRFPLPIEIDEVTGVATLHPLLIRGLAGVFDPAWLPLLDSRAAATVAPPAATVRADVTAFLAAEPTTLARGLHLGARALTNAVAELPFIRETFLQLGPASFDVALALMDNIVNRQVSLLAGQRDGAAILAEIRGALAAAPAVLTAEQQASLNRANLMLGLVVGVVPVAPPVAARNRPEKTVTIDTVKLDGSTHNPATDVAVANGILSQCNVRLAHVIDATATNAETTTWLGGNTDLQTVSSCGSSTAEERNLFSGATARFGLAARLRAFYPATLSGQAGTGYSVPAFCATGTAAALRRMIVLTNPTTREDLAHEVGHVLLNSGAHPASNLMSATAPRAVVRLTDPQCTTIYNNA